MILADKILRLRKSNGWSQEELAEKMNVSRQSISKWESAAAIPDINKILELARLFGVSTDYMLKDEIEAPAYFDTEETDNRKRISLQEMSEILRNKVIFARQTALGVVLCILSPVLLILLSGMAAEGAFVNNGAAEIIGITALLLMVAAAVALFIISKEKMKRFSYLQTGEFELEYGVSGIVKQKRADYEKRYLLSVVLGVVLCILCSFPLILAGIIGAADLVYIVLTVLLFVIVAAGVSLMINANTIKDGYDQLLYEGKFKHNGK